jgi:nicotinic acid phosphoribosyltransferase
MDTETHNNIISALLTDSYKIIMAYSFFESNMHEDHTAFELFFRKCPFGG